MEAGDIQIHYGDKHHHKPREVGAFKRLPMRFRIFLLLSFIFVTITPFAFMWVIKQDFIGVYVISRVVRPPDATHKLPMVEFMTLDKKVVREELEVEDEELALPGTLICIKYNPQNTSEIQISSRVDKTVIIPNMFAILGMGFFVLGVYGFFTIGAIPIPSRLKRRRARVKADPKGLDKFIIQ